MPGKKKIIPKHDIETILSAGYSREEAARMLSVSPVTLRKAIRYYGIDAGRKNRPSCKDGDERPIRVSPELQAWFDSEGERLLREFFRRLHCIRVKKADHA